MKLALILALLLGGWEIRAFRVDLNRDGKPEVVTLRPYIRDGVRYGRLVVTDTRGNTLWAAPKEPPYVFGGEFDLGEIEMVGDLLGDGTIELLGTGQKSDVRPTRYRLFRWDGKRFVFVKSGDLVPRNQMPATFEFANAPGAQRWVERIHEFKNGRLRATVNDYATGQEEVWLRPTPEGWFVLSQ